MSVLMRESGLPGGGPVRVDTGDLLSRAQILQNCGGSYWDLGLELAPLLSQLGLLAGLDLSGQAAGALAGASAVQAGVERVWFQTWRLGEKLRQVADSYQQVEDAAAGIFADYQEVRGDRGLLLDFTSGFVVKLALSAFKVEPDFFRSEGYRSFSRQTGQKLNRVAELLGYNGDLKAYHETTDYFLGLGPDGRGPVLEPATSAKAITQRLALVSAAETAVDAVHGERGYAVEFDGVAVQVQHNPETGQRLYEVLIPGTDSLGLTGGPNSWLSTVDNTESLYDDQLALRDLPAQQQLVLEALEAAGAQPGDAITLTGFSQGGVAAMSLANNRNLAQLYEVKALVTSGAPVRDVALRDEVLHVDISHRSDPVPRLQGQDASYSPDYPLVFEDQQLGPGVHGANQYASFAQDGEASRQSLAGLETVYQGLVPLGTARFFSGTSQKHNMNHAQLARRNSLGLLNGVHAVAQKIPGNRYKLPFIDSASMNPGEIYDDTAYQFEAWGAKNLETAYLDAVSRQDGMVVLEPDAQDHLENVRDIVGASDVVSNQDLTDVLETLPGREPEPAPAQDSLG